MLRNNSAVNLRLPDLLRPQLLNLLFLLRSISRTLNFLLNSNLSCFPLRLLLLKLPALQQNISKTPKWHNTTPYPHSNDSRTELTTNCSDRTISEN